MEFAAGPGVGAGVLRPRVSGRLLGGFLGCGVDPLVALRAACVSLARGIGGPEGVALGAACLGLVEAHERKRARGGMGDCSGGCDISPYPSPALACGDRGLLLELGEDPDCSPYYWE